MFLYFEKIVDIFAAPPKIISEKVKKIIDFFSKILFSFLFKILFVVFAAFIWLSAFIY